MDAARELLAVTGSPLAVALRSGLVGLRAAMVDLLDRVPDDPGRTAGDRLVVALEELLEPGHASDPASTVSTTTSTTTAAAFPVAPAPWPAVDELVLRPEAPRELRGLDTSAPVGELWRRLHAVTLRMPPATARSWRDAVSRALPPPDPVREPGWRDLPADSDEVLVPPFGDQPGWRTSPGAPASDEVAQRLSADEATAPLRSRVARLATTVLAMVELDEDLLLGLESVQFHGLEHFDHRRRAAYRRDTLDRLADWDRTTHGTPASFAALRLVDEALNSVLHLPAASPGSWWARLHEQARALVFDAQRDHPGTDAMVLARSYREARQRTGDNDVRFPLDRSGTVLFCLRLWARVDDTELPGRVVYAG